MSYTTTGCEEDPKMSGDELPPGTKSKRENRTAENGSRIKEQAGRQENQESRCSESQG